MLLGRLTAPDFGGTRPAAEPQARRTDRCWQGTIANILSVIFQFKMKWKLIFF